jgi:hypothetical protein
MQEEREWSERRTEGRAAEKWELETGSAWKGQLEGVRTRPRMYPYEGYAVDVCIAYSTLVSLPSLSALRIHLCPMSPPVCTLPRALMSATNAARAAARALSGATPSASAMPLAVCEP